MIRAAALSLALLASAPAGAFDLALPLDCTLGDTCFIQQYADHDPGPSAQDFTCGPLSYQNHDGTDIALPSLAAMQAGVTVLAAAAGTVKGVRDSMPDIAANDPNAPDRQGRDCGNGVLIDHADGWQTQYCHMKQGSVRVAAGDSVTTGQPIGEVGLSGNTEFPHLHITLRQNGMAVDPFAPDAQRPCGPPAQPIWSPALPYQPGGLISVGIASAMPEFDALKQGLPLPPTLPAAAPALVVWAYMFGGQAGDTLDLALTGPNGTIIASTVTLEKTQAQLFRATGKRLKDPSGWPPGIYTATVSHRRSGKEISARAVTMQITR